MKSIVEFVSFAKVRRIQYDATNKRQLNLNFQNACKYGHLSIVNFLIDNPHLNMECPPYTFDQSLYYACIGGHLGVVDRLLIDSRVDPAIDNNDILAETCACGQLAVVERLLRDVRVKPCDGALGSAVYEGHIQLVERLLKDPRVTPESDGNWVLVTAMFQQQFAIVALLLENPIILFHPYPNAMPCGLWRYGISSKRQGAYRDLLDLITMKRIQWYARRKRRFQRLHNELVALHFWPSV